MDTCIDVSGYGLVGLLSQFYQAVDRICEVTNDSELDYSLVIGVASDLHGLYASGMYENYNSRQMAMASAGTALYGKGWTNGMAEMLSIKRATRVKDIVSENRTKISHKLLLDIQAGLSSASYNSSVAAYLLTELAISVSYNSSELIEKIEQRHSHIRRLRYSSALSETNVKALLHYADHQLTHVSSYLSTVKKFDPIFGHVINTTGQALFGDRWSSVFEHSIDGFRFDASDTILNEDQVIHLRRRSIIVNLLEEHSDRFTSHPMYRALYWMSFAITETAG